MTLPMLVYGAIIAHHIYYGYQPVPILGPILGIPEIPGIQDVKARRDDRNQRESYDQRLKDQRASADLSWRAFKTPGNYSSASVETAHNDLSQSRLGRSLTSKPKIRGKQLSILPKGYFYTKKKGVPCAPGFKYHRDSGMCIKT